MDQLIISKGAKDGQLLVLIIFLTMFSLLLLTAFLTSNINYLLIVAFGLVFFSPVYLFYVRLFDITFEGDYFFVRNLFKEVKVHKTKFQKVIPMPSLPIAFNNPYFTIVFTNGEKYNFVRRKDSKSIFHSRMSRSNAITLELVEICR